MGWAARPGHRAADPPAGWARWRGPYDDGRAHWQQVGPARRPRYMCRSTPDAVRGRAGHCARSHRCKSGSTGGCRYDRALELGKGQQHIEGQPPHRARGIELLGDRDERHSLRVEDLDQPGKIGERAGQPVDLVDDDDIDPAFPDVGEQALQSGPLHVATREPAVVVAGPGQCPALVTLTADVGLAGFALRLERVELLLEPFLGGFAGVDRGALPARVTARHRYPPSSRGSEAALARAGGLPIGFVSARRTADPTTPCR